MGIPQSIAQQKFWRRGEINEATLKDLLANSFCCVVCFDEGEGVPSHNFCEAKHRLHTVQLHLRYSATSFAAGNIGRQSAVSGRRSAVGWLAKQAVFSV